MNTISPPPSRVVRYLILAGAVLILSGGAVLLYALYWPNTFPDQAERLVFVSRGATFQTIVDSLDRSGVIRSRLLFRVTARLAGGTERLQAGKYHFYSGLSNLDIYLSLRDGRNTVLIGVTIPEGLRARAQARLFARALGIDSARYMSIVNDPAIVRAFGLEGGSLEGYLLPDTYRLMWEQDEREIVERQVDEFKRFFNDSLEARAKEFGWTVQQAVTFASIVEGEAVLADERPVIAGVYHNRLRLGMKLEADPTLQYIFTDGPRRVLYVDLRITHPYNTYLYPGLPPGPVNNPGKASVLAALYPRQHGYLFFVANTLGGHWFAKTYSEHVQNVRKYRRSRARN